MNLKECALPAQARPFWIENWSSRIMTLVERQSKRWAVPSRDSFVFLPLNFRPKMSIYVGPEDQQEEHIKWMQVALEMVPRAICTSIG
jgi:hypothetical protein